MGPWYSPGLYAMRFELLSNFWQNILRLGVMHLGMVPSMNEAMFNIGPGGGEESRQIGLKYLASGGETRISESVSGFLAKWKQMGMC